MEEITYAGRKSEDDYNDRSDEEGRMSHEEDTIEVDMTEMYAGENGGDTSQSTQRSRRVSKAPQRYQDFLTGTDYPTTEATEEEEEDVVNRGNETIVNDLAGLKTAMCALGALRSNKGSEKEDLESIASISIPNDIVADLVDETPLVINDDANAHWGFSPAVTVGRGTDITASASNVISDGTRRDIDRGKSCSFDRPSDRGNGRGSGHTFTRGVRRGSGHTFIRGVGRGIDRGSGRGYGQGSSRGARGISASSAGRGVDQGFSQTADNGIAPVRACEPLNVNVIVETPRNVGTFSDDSDIDNIEDDAEKLGLPVGTNSAPMLEKSGDRARNKRALSNDAPRLGPNGGASRSGPPQKRLALVHTRSDDDKRWDFLCETIGKIYQDIRAFRKEEKTRYDALNERLDRLEGDIVADRSGAFPQKPDCLPLRTLADLAAFETIDDRGLDKVVAFLGSLSNGSVHERANVILKDAVVDDFSVSLTAQGREPDKHKLEGTRFSDALYSAICKDIARNEKPTRREYVVALTAALKASKQRYRRAHPTAAQ